MITVALFVLYCRFSMLGNTWAAVAQVLSPRTRDLVAVAANMTDKQVQERLKQRSLANTRVGLSVADGGGSPAQPGIMEAQQRKSS